MVNVEVGDDGGAEECRHAHAEDTIRTETEDTRADASGERTAADSTIYTCV